MAENGDFKPVKANLDGSALQSRLSDDPTSDSSSQKASDAVQDALKSGADVSSLYNSLSADDQRKVFLDLKKASTDGSTGLNNLIVSGIDTDGDGKEDKLADLFDSNSDKDLYNRPTEDPDSIQASKDRKAEIQKREEALFKKLDNGDGYLTSAELKTAIDSGTLKGFDANTAKMWQTFREPIEEFNSDRLLKEGITEKDIKHPDYERFRQFAARPDVGNIFESYQRSLQTMISDGERISGSGTLNAMWNNAQNKYGGNDKILECYGQAEKVLQGLADTKLSGKWDLHLIGELNTVGAAAMTFGAGSPGHYKVELVPHDPKDPIVVIDPWKDSFEIKDPKAFKPSGATHFWSDSKGNGGLGDFKERQDRQDRHDLFEQWRKGDRSTKFDKWLIANHPDKRHLLEVNAPGATRRKEYSLSDYARERWERL